MKVLIVEDETIFRMDLAIRLRSLGFTEVAQTAYAAQSVEMARESSFDLILMDIRLKDELSGIDAARLIAQERPVPIIFMSAYRLNVPEVQATIATTLRFVPKPVSDDSLREAIKASVSPS